MSRHATGPEQTPLHQREAPAGGPAHAEEEPHGCLSAQQLDAGEEPLILALLTLTVRTHRAIGEATRMNDAKMQIFPVHT